MTPMYTARKQFPPVGEPGNRPKNAMGCGGLTQLPIRGGSTFDG